MSMLSGSMNSRPRRDHLGRPHRVSDDPHLPRATDHPADSPQQDGPPELRPPRNRSGQSVIPHDDLERPLHPGLCHLPHKPLHSPGRERLQRQHLPDLAAGSRGQGPRRLPDDDRRMLSSGERPVLHYRNDPPVLTPFARFRLRFPSPRAPLNEEQDSQLSASAEAFFLSEPVILRSNQRRGS